jgi:hypothetical protein
MLLCSLERSTFKQADKKINRLQTTPSRNYALFGYQQKDRFLDRTIFAKPCVPSSCGKSVMPLYEQDKNLLGKFI